LYDIFHNEAIVTDNQSVKNVELAWEIGRNFGCAYSFILESIGLLTVF